MNRLIIFGYLIIGAKDSESESTEVPNARGGRRRAAAQAVGSLKELPTNKKLRQGDQQFNKSFQYSQSIQKDDRTKENKDSNALKSRKSSEAKRSTRRK